MPLIAMQGVCESNAALAAEIKARVFAEVCACADAEAEAAAAALRVSRLQPYMPRLQPYVPSLQPYVSPGA